MIKDTRFIPLERRQPIEEEGDTEDTIDFEEIFLKKPRKPGLKLYIAS